ncbi:hypothetical protein SRHO_G00231970 [Serrasalmus rhombeus]
MDPQQVPGLESIIVQISLQTAHPGGETPQREQDRGEASDGRAPDRGRMLETPCRITAQALHTASSRRPTQQTLDQPYYTQTGSNPGCGVKDWSAGGSGKAGSSWRESKMERGRVGERQKERGREMLWSVNAEGGDGKVEHPHQDDHHNSRRLPCRRASNGRRKSHTREKAQLPAPPC